MFLVKSNYKLFDLTRRISLPVSIILCSMVLASFWVFLVPIFQSPDEDYHADYVFSLYSKGRLIPGNTAPIVTISNPFTIYLLNMTDTQRVTYHTYEKMPNDYGTKRFFKKLDAGAPNRNVCKNTPSNPLMMAVYPVGYYALAALWMGFFSCFSKSLTFLFFITRFFSVVLLGAGLTFSYLAMRELSIPKWQSCLMLAALAFFPLTSFVGSYIQPDNLGFTAASVCLYLSLIWRNSLQDWAIWLLGLCMAILLLSKYQFFCCVSTAILAMVITKSIYSKISKKRLLAVLVLLSVPSVMAALIQLRISWHCYLPVIDDKHDHWFAVTTEFAPILGMGGQALVSFAREALRNQFDSMYTMLGPTFISFWGDFGWLDTPLILGSIKVDGVVRALISLVSKVILLLTIASLLKKIMELVRISRKGHFYKAVYLACANPFLNSYFLFVVFMFLFNVAVYPSFAGQGRHWFPFIFPMIVAAAIFAPRAIPSRTIREKITLLVIVGWLCYSIAGSYYAIADIHKRYYEEDRQLAIDWTALRSAPIRTRASIQRCDFLDKYPTFNRHLNTLMVPQGAYMETVGWAIDDIALEPALAVFLCVDNNKVYRATYGLENKEAVNKLHLKTCRFSGFTILLPTKDLSLGWHSLAVKVVSKNGCLLYDTDASLRFIVLEPSAETCNR